ncbi:MAG: complex I NDUFA9 subunit family protein [Alphaproteobacteria bacterium]|nr:complex I NDUFA9 subunit family protein [Alphaproteobacteria bacterium]
MPAPNALSKNALITIFGGTGFLGRHIVRRLSKQGYRLRIATRRPNEALFLKTNGKPGQIEIVQANIRDAASIAAALDGAQGVVNAVGILFESGKQKFEAVQARGAALVADAAAKQGITHMVHISAIGADADSASSYATSKATGEAAVLECVPQAHILRPSIVIGPEDDFFNRFAAMSMVAPALPLIGGGETRYQPVSVFDVAEAVAACLGGSADSPKAGAEAGIYELGGPDILSFKQLMEMLNGATGRNRLLVPLPFFAAAMIAAVAQFSTLIGVSPLLTPDQIILLKSDNIVGDDKTVRDFAALGISPRPIAGQLDYLSRYRPHGKK